MRRTCEYVVRRLDAVALITAGALGATSPALAQVAGGCGQWSVVANPLFEGQETIPTLVVPFDPDTAVGIRNVNPAGVISVARMAWDGAAWSVVATDPIPDLEGGTGWNMRAVRGAAPDDLWATGLVGLDNFHGVPFLAHFDGTSWTAELATIFEDPNPQAGDPIRTAEASDLVILGSDDIWVLGAGEDVEQTVSNPVACHWDGSNLEEVQPIQAVYNHRNTFEAADGSAPDSIWIVGYGRNTGDLFHLLTHRWDGSQWLPETSWSPLPGPAALEDFLFDVVAFAADDVWAVGKKLVVVDGTAFNVSFYLHWDGSGWTEVEGPDVGTLTSVTGSGPDDLWASSAFGDGTGRVAHYDGTAWTAVDTAPLPGATHIGLSRIFASPVGDVWTIGYWGIYDGAGGWAEYHDLIEHFTDGCPPGDANGDGVVGGEDLVQVVLGWGPCTGPCPCDFDGSGAVDGADLVTVILNWTG